eukprot:XP_011673909.1 PREDICTED: uncharacterized protein LOC105442931 isoform X2 [Strongylocentrotus purpuratus]
MASAFCDPLAPSPCDQCGNATEGTMRCSVRDSKNLCQDCFQGVPQARREDIGDPEWVCNIHLNRKVDIYCETCRLGCCKECAVDVHKGHSVVDVLKLLGKIRRDLTKQMIEVGVRAERLSELQRKIESSVGKIEEAPKLVDKVVDEIKDEIAHNLHLDVHIIQWETHLNIIQQEKRRDNMLKLAKEKAELDIQRIQELQRGISTGLLEDAEKRKCKIQKAESKLLVGQQACESANLEIKLLLESTPKELACRGRRLGSLVEASSEFQCQNDVLDCCREVEADLPKLEVEKDNFFHGIRPFSPLLKTVLCIFVVFYVANEARCDYRYEYNRLLSSESMTSLIMLCAYFTHYFVVKCLVLMLILDGSMGDHPIKRKDKKLKSCYKMAQLGIQFWLLTFVFLILVSSPLYLFQVKSVSANIVSIMSILHSCSSLYGMRNSKTFKDFWDYLKLYKI